MLSYARSPAALQLLGNASGLLNKPMTRGCLCARMSRRAQEPISHKPTVDPSMTVDGSERSNDGDFNASVRPPRTSFASSSTGELILDDPAQYSGTVAGFGVNTRIDLPSFGATGAHATSYTGGVLTLTTRRPNGGDQDQRHPYAGEF